MTTIKRTVQVHFAVQADTPVSELDTCYINLNAYDLGAHGFPTVALKQVEIEIDTDKFIEVALSTLDDTEQKMRAEFQQKLETLQAARANLLSLPAPSAPTPQPNVLDFVSATTDHVEAYDRPLPDVFYVTYGFDTCQAFNFSRVFATDYAAARELIFKQIGSKFAFCYNEAEFDGQVKAYGLSEIPLTAHEISPF